MSGDDLLHVELWTSWASLLRSYAAAHGLHTARHAVVEVSYDVITLRVGSAWLRFTHTVVESSTGAPQAFHLNENGTVSISNAPEQEMDLAAEQFTRELLHAAEA